MAVNVLAFRVLGGDKLIPKNESNFRGKKMDDISSSDQIRLETHACACSFSILILLPKRKIEKAF
jgi:hypothetical protein